METEKNEIFFFYVCQGRCLNTFISGPIVFFFAGNFKPYTAINKYIWIIGLDIFAGKEPLEPGKPSRNRAALFYDLVIDHRIRWFFEPYRLNVLHLVFKFNNIILFFTCKKCQSPVRDAHET